MESRSLARTNKPSSRDPIELIHLPTYPQPLQHPPPPATVLPNLDIVIFTQETWMKGLRE